jgi:hypothetical protein
MVVEQVCRHRGKKKKKERKKERKVELDAGSDRVMWTLFLSSRLL